MPLTLRTNGNQITNVIGANWFNDFYTMFTGGMPDQPISFAPNTTLKSQLSAPTVAPTAITAAGGSLGVGVYKYAYTFVMADGGESLASPTVSITTTTTNKSNNVQTIPAGPTGTTKRNIYRTKVGGTTLFLLTTLNDNTTSSYLDTIADTSLPSTTAPTHSTFGGTLFLKDATGALNLTISPDGSFYGPNGNITLNGTVLITNGKLGRTTGGDIIDAAGSTTYIKGIGTICFQIPNGTNVAAVTTSALDMMGNNILNANSISTASLATTGTIGVGGNLNIAQGMAINASQLSFVGNGMIFSAGVQLNGPLLLQPGNVATPSTIQIGTAGMGVKNNSGTKLMELKNNGTMVISGNTYYGTGAGSVGTGGTFDTFDLAEVYAVDQEYTYGVVVCPADTTTPIPFVYDYSDKLLPMFTQCTHDKCNLAHIIVKIPGVMLGAANLPSEPDFYDPNQPLSEGVALAGRVFAVTSSTSIAARDYVCSDGMGGVRPMVAGESGFALGTVLSPVSNGLVPILVRPTFVVL